MRRISALLEKELRQHGLGFVLAWVLAACGFAVLSLPARGTGNVTFLEVHLNFARIFLPIVAAVLGHRLIVTEYQAQTQRFLEGLPMHRAEWVSLKLALGLVIVEACALSSLSASVWIAAQREPVAVAHVTMMAARTVVWSACLWTFFALTGSAGRFRFVIYGVLVACAAMVDETTNLEWARVAPFSLVDERMVLERSIWPVEALAYATGISVIMLLGAVSLSLFHDGVVAESLSRRMSQKEKALLGFVVFAALTLASAFDERQAKKPYTLTGSNVSRSKRVALQIETASAGVGHQLLATLEADILAFRVWLQLPKLPPVFIAQRSDLDRRTIEPVTLPHNDGLLLRANLTAKGFTEDALRFELIQGLYAQVTEGRSRFEPRAWIVDGLLRDWVERRLGAASPSLLRGLWATRESGVDATMLARWGRTRERFGAQVAEGIAHTGIEVLARLRGRAAVEALSKTALRRWAPHDARALFYEWRHPLDDAFEAATGVAYHAFLARWNAELKTMRQEARFAALAKLPRAKVSLQVRASEGQVRDVHYRVVLDRAPEGAPLLALAHYAVGAYDKGPVTPLEVQRDEHPWPDGDGSFTGVLHGAYGAGERALLVVELENDALGVPLRLHAERRSFE